MSASIWNRSESKWTQFALARTAMVLAALALAACETLEPEKRPVQAHLAAPAPQGLATKGKALADAYCATCHATGKTGSSPYAPAPTFPVIAKKYPPEMLAEALAEGIAVGHKGPVQMPEFAFRPEEIDALIGYLESLR